MLEYDVRLWQAILVQSTDRARAIELTRKLLDDAKQKGLIWLGCIGRTYDGDLAEDLSNLDADLFLAVMSEVWPKNHLAQICNSRAYSRWLDRQKDAFTGILAKYAVENGAANGDVMRIHSRYELPKVLEQARKGVLTLPITDLAWHDPDAALAIAEKEPDEMQRRGMIDMVARVWAYKRPDQIERAIKNQDNEVRRSWARDLAREELEWRKKGNPPATLPRRSRTRFGLSQRNWPELRGSRRPLCRNCSMTRSEPRRPIGGSTSKRRTWGSGDRRTTPSRWSSGSSRPTSL